MPFADRDDGSIFYVKKNTTKLYKFSKARTARPKDPLLTELLWGDRVRLLKNPDGSFKKENSRYRARARGQYGWVKKSDLGNQQLLELYFIDVGQGDGLLIRTPGGKHLLIDGGWPRKSQPTGKNASDFIDWKFIKDYESKTIELDDIICSHNDQDHYGGIWDLLNKDQLDGGRTPEFDAESVSVERFYHAGLSWWTIAGSRSLGKTVDSTVGKLFTQLLDDRTSLVDGLSSSANPKLQGEWAKFLRKVKDAKKLDGTNTNVARLSHMTGILPGYDGTGSTPGSAPEPTIHVLAPVEFDVDGKPAIRNFDDSQASKNTNGNSVLLRMDCGDVRILLTGDLNTLSQNSLLSDYRGSEDEFECDVAKACHHGSGDVSYKFLETMAPLVTIISSGDSEGHDHPKPEIIAASAMSGTKTVKNDKLATPLIYITELARSVEVGSIDAIEELDANGDPQHEIDFSSLQATTKVIRAGDRAAETVERRLEGGRMMTKTVYGLINVRTDGKKIMCAALNEKKSTWNYKVLDPKPR